MEESVKEVKDRVTRIENNQDHLKDEVGQVKAILTNGLTERSKDTQTLAKDTANEVRILNESVIKIGLSHDHLVEATEDMSKQLITHIEQTDRTIKAMHRRIDEEHDHLVGHTTREEVMAKERSSTLDRIEKKLDKQDEKFDKTDEKLASIVKETSANKTAMYRMYIAALIGIISGFGWAITHLDDIKNILQ